MRPQSPLCEAGRLLETAGVQGRERLTGQALCRLLHRDDLAELSAASAADGLLVEVDRACWTTARHEAQSR